MEHKVEEVKLKCGAKGLLIDVPEAPVFCMEVYFRAGDAYTSGPDKMESAHLMEHLAFGANSVQPNMAEVSRFVKKYGASNNAHTSRNFLAYEIVCPDFDWKRLLKQLIVQITTPKFLEEEFKAEFGNVEEEMRLRSNNKWNELSAVMAQRAGWTFSETELERLELMKNVTLSDIKAHYNKTHGPKNATFFIAGPIKGNKKEILEILEGLSVLPGKKRFDLPKRPDLKGFPSNPVVINKSDVPNVYVSLDMLSNTKKDEEEVVANLAVLTKILSSGDHSRIYGKARQRGLVYDLGTSRNNSYTGDYGIELYCQVGLENIDNLLDLVVSEFRDVLKNGLTKEEVREAVDSISGGLRMDNQTARSILGYNRGWYISSEVERIHNYDHFSELFSEVTPESIQELFVNLIKTKKWGAGFLGNVTEAQAKKWNKKLAEIFED